MDLFRQGPYVIFGIPRDATESQIRRAYRRLAMRFHPDRNPDDPEAEERFKQVQWAYENLMGQKGQEDISSMVFSRKSYASPFAGSTRPFYDFFWALRVFYDKKEDGKKTSSQHGKENGGQNLPKDQ